MPYETRCKTGRTSAKFVPRTRVGLFRIERTRSTPLEPKLTFWYISFYLRAFGTVWLPYGTRCKTGRTSAKVCATKSSRNFSQRTHPTTPLDPKLMFWCILYHWVPSGPFGCLTKLGGKRADLVKSSCHEVASEFLATNAPDPPHLALN